MVPGMKPLLFACALIIGLAASCKLGPFPDEPVEHPTAPEPDWGGVSRSGLGDAGAPAR